MSGTAPGARGGRRRRRRVVGRAPGTVAVDPAAPAPVLRVLAYGPDGMHDQPAVDLAEVPQLLARWPVLWLDVDGLGDAAVLEQVAALFRFHPLALEDVVNTHQRAKVESYDEHEFVVLRNPEVGELLDTEQLALFVGRNYVVTFQERAGDWFDPVRARLQNPSGRLRQGGPDYLAYALIDAVIDAYFPILERHGEGLEALEDQLLGHPVPAGVMAELQRSRRDLLTLRRAIWPLREVVNGLMREECRRVTAATRVYLRDCYDHVAQLIDLVETDRELSANLMELYLSSTSQRLNEVMKVLTVIATIFIPLTFVVGVYGMNFRYMPELEWRYGYFATLAAMGGMALGMLWWFRRRGWL